MLKAAVKSVFAIALACALLCILPVGAFAAEDGGEVANLAAGSIQKVATIESQAAIEPQASNSLADADLGGQASAWSAASINMLLTCPDIRVILNGRQLVEGVDYTVAYTLNRASAYAVYTAKGIGDYTGSIRRVINVYREQLTALDVIDIDPKTYTGKEIKPNPLVVGNREYLQKGRDYTLAYSNNVKPGKAKVTITAKGLYYGTFSKTFTIEKARQPLTVKAKAVTVKYAKRKSRTVAASRAYTVTKNVGALSYKKTYGNKKILVSSKGKITVKKGLKRGKYKVCVQVKAKATTYYKAISKTVSVYVTVK